MVAILKMSAKLAALGLLNIKMFEIKNVTSKFLSMKSPTKFHHVTYIDLYCRCDHVTEVW